MTGAINIGRMDHHEFGLVLPDDITGAIHDKVIQGRVFPFYHIRKIAGNNFYHFQTRTGSGKSRFHGIPGTLRPVFINKAGLCHGTTTGTGPALTIIKLELSGQLPLKKR